MKIMRGLDCYRLVVVGCCYLLDNNTREAKRIFGSAFWRTPAVWDPSRSHDVIRKNDAESRLATES